MTMYKNEMNFHMLMFMNAWMMLVLMKCRCQMQCLTPGCYMLELPTHVTTTAVARQSRACQRGDAAATMA